MSPSVKLFAFVLCETVMLPGCSDSSHNAKLELEREIENSHASLQRESEAFINQKSEQIKKEAVEFSAKVEQRFGASSSGDVSRRDGQVNSELESKSGSTGGALLKAVGINDIRQVNSLLSDGADPNYRSPDGGTPLVMAAALGNAGIVDSLIKKGAAVNQTAGRDISPLLACVQQNHIDVVKLLLKNGADIEQATRHGVTPLLAAVTFRHEDIALYLLEQGASTLAKNAVNASVLEVAYKNELKRVITRVAEMKREFIPEPGTAADKLERTEVQLPVIEKSDNSDRSEVAWVRFPAAGLKLRRPPGFSDGERFDGFQQESSQASVVVAMLPGSFQECTSQFTEKRMFSAGMSIISRKDTQHDGQAAMLLNVNQVVNGTLFEKWILAFGDAKETRLITASHPINKSGEFTEIMKSTVLSARLDTRTADELFREGEGTDDLFSIEETGRLKRVRNASIGKLLIFTLDGEFPLTQPDNPIFIVTVHSLRLVFENSGRFAIPRA
jgi:ankyrin repeat protein